MIANLEAERAVIGAVLLDQGVYFQAADLLPQTFSLESNALIWMAIQDLNTAGEEISTISLAEKMGKEFSKVGGHAYLSDLIDAVPDRKSIEPGFLRLILGKQAERRAAYNPLCS